MRNTAESAMPSDMSEYAPPQQKFGESSGLAVQMHLHEFEKLLPIGWQTSVPAGVHEVPERIQ
jgi:hypothetical protein